LSQSSLEQSEAQQSKSQMAENFPCTLIDHGRNLRVGVVRILSLFVVVLLVLFTAAPSLAVTPESPEVRELIEQGLSYLEEHTDERLGGKCLIGLAFLKDGASLDHPRIVEALEACKSHNAQEIRNEPGGVYSNGLAIIFLAELDATKHRDLIQRYAGAMVNRQKSHGGWGYDAYPTGDTSQTQYAVLAYWSLLQAGVAPKVESIESATNWLLRTQDPAGPWGYQGTDPGSFELVEQTRTDVSMLAAGLGSVLMAANILGEIKPGEAKVDGEFSEPKEELPAALQRVEASEAQAIRSLSGGKIDKDQLQKSIAMGKQWFDKNFHEIEGEYPYYILYSIERYKSFEEYLTGDVEEVPDWYVKGYEYVKKTQKDHGGWESPAGAPCATAFATLFLMRSMQKSIKASLGEGTLVGGRGLSANLARMKLQGGRLVTAPEPTEIDKLLEMLEGTGGADFDALQSGSLALDVSNVGPEEARRLQQILKSGTPEARLMAAKTLGQLRNLDYVPDLLYALTDPDNRVVRSARDGLKFISRRFDGFGPPDVFNETERYDSIEKWKNWYRRIRPGANVF